MTRPLFSSEIYGPCRRCKAAAGKSCTTAGGVETDRAHAIRHFDWCQRPDVPTPTEGEVLATYPEDYR